MKTVYVASRFSLKNEVKEIYKRLFVIGYEPAYDWTVHEDLRPFHENSTRCAQYTTEDLQGVLDCDIFILIASKENEKGTGMHTELGAALACLYFKKNIPKIIYVVGPKNSSVMFYFHSAIRRLDHIDAVIRELETLR